MTKEKIKFNRISNDGWGISFDVIQPKSMITGEIDWDPSEKDRQCMLDELVDLLTRNEIVVVPLSNAEVMFSNDQELIDFVRAYNFTVQFNCFQKSFVCTLENKIGG